jgi:predicted dehydrogenase
MRTPVAIALVGYGYWGPNLARIFNAMPSSALVAVCDVSGERRDHMKNLYPDVACYEDFEEMLATADFDAVAIATPLKSHHKLAKASLLAGKHVLLEKPMASSSEECIELIALAKLAGLTLMVGHTYLYSEPVNKVAEIIRSGEVGELRYINCQRLNLGLFKQDINVAWDLATHDISIILHVMGELPLVVNCQGNAHINPEIEDVTNLSLSFREKRFATVQSSWLEPRKVRQMTFVGTRKMIIYDDLQPLEKIRIYDVRVECPPHYDSFAEFQYSYHYGDCYIPHIDQVEPLNQMCRHFVSCIEEGAMPKTSGGKGLEVVRILEASTESLMAHGGPVPFAGPRVVPSPAQESSLSNVI